MYYIIILYCIIIIYYIIIVICVNWCICVYYYIVHHPAWYSNPSSTQVQQELTVGVKASWTTIFHRALYPALTHTHVLKMSDVTHGAADQISEDSWAPWSLTFRKWLTSCLFSESWQSNRAKCQTSTWLKVLCGSQDPEVGWDVDLYDLFPPHLVRILIDIESLNDIIKISTLNIDLVISRHFAATTVVSTVGSCRQGLQLTPPSGPSAVLPLKPRGPVESLQPVTFFETQEMGWAMAAMVGRPSCD